MKLGVHLTLMFDWKRLSVSKRRQGKDASNKDCVGVHDEL